MSDTPQIPANLWIIWGAMVSSIFIYGIVGVVAAPPPMGDEDPITPLAIAVTAMGPALMSLVSHRIIKGQPFRVHSIIRWAFAESVGVFGLVTHFVGGPLALMLVLQAWSIFLLVLGMPTQSRYEAWAKHQ